MPHSPDEPSSAPPAEIVEGQGSDASPPNASIENASNGSVPRNTAAQDAVPRSPRRRRRRRRPQPRPSTEPVSDALTKQTVSAHELSPADGPPDSSRGMDESNRLPRRRRRRRRGPTREPAPQGVTLTSDVQIEEGVRAADAEQSTPGEDPAQSLPGQATRVQNNAPRQRPRRRYQYRRPPRESSWPDGSFASQGSSEAVDGNGPSPIERSPTDGPRNRQSHSAGLRDLDPQSEHLQEQRPRSETGGRGGRASDRRAGGAGPSRQPRRGARDRHQRRGREAPLKKPEQRLYALESVIDRGFEDVVDDAGESAPRRVHWTIIKRTVADQKSGKPMSAVYVLQREGVDAEYPNLGAARAAVNKTIVHPEKLTMSKAEHAAAKK